MLRYGSRSEKDRGGVGIVSQKIIWDYFQGDGIESFDDAIPRLRFLLSLSQKKTHHSAPRVLNIGAGNGWLEVQCNKRKWCTYSLDPSEVAVRRLTLQGIRATVGVIEDIPFADNKFDVVFCTEVFEHLTDEQLRNGLKNIVRILKPGGFIIGTVPYNEQLSNNLVVCPNCGSRFHRWGHLQAFNKQRIRSLLASNGFDQVWVDLYSFPGFSRRSVKNKVKSLIRWLLGRMGSPIAVPSIVFCSV